MLAFLRKHLAAAMVLLAAFLVAAAFLIVFVPSTSVPSYGSVAFADDTKIIVEIADSPVERARGLSGREEIQESFGMLFLFPEPDVYSFWMPDMNFAIDIIWIQDDMVIDVDEEVSPEGTLPLARYVPDEPVNRVLEVRAGFVQRHKIDIGERLDIRLETN